MQTSATTPLETRGLSGRRRAWHLAMRAVMYLSAAITCALALGLIGYILWRGVPGLSWEFLTTQESILKGTDGILPAIQNTIYVIVVTLVIIALCVYLCMEGYSYSFSPQIANMYSTGASKRTPFGMIILKRWPKSTAGHIWCPLT